LKIPYGKAAGFRDNAQILPSVSIGLTAASGSGLAKIPVDCMRRIAFYMVIDEDLESGVCA